MAITIQCPNVKCQQTVSVQEEISGRNVKCKKCGTAFRETPTMDGQSRDTAQTSQGSDTGLFRSYQVDGHDAICSQLASLVNNSERSWTELTKPEIPATGVPVEVPQDCGAATKVCVSGIADCLSRSSSAARSARCASVSMPNSLTYSLTNGGELER